MAKKQTPQGRRRATKRAAPKSAETKRDEARLKQLNVEIQGMVSSGAARVRPGKLRELQAEAEPIATRLRGRRRAKKKST